MGVSDIRKDEAKTAPPDTAQAPDGFNMLDPAFAANPRPIYRELRNNCPVARIGPRRAVVVSRYEDVHYALTHSELFSSGVAAAPLGNVRPLIPLQIDPPAHGRYRKILDPLFARKKVIQLEPEIRTLANQLIDKFIDRGECEFDSEFAIPYPCTVFLQLMGLPQEELPLFLEFKDGIIRPPTRDLNEADRMRAEMGQRIYAYFEKVIDERERSPRDDLMTYFLRAEVDGKRLTREEILDICYLFILGGLDTVTATLGCSIAYLAEHPEQRRALVEDPSLIPFAIEELLRWETPVAGVPRVTTQDCTLGGVELKAGEQVLLLLGSADTDEREFPEGDRTVDFRREPNRHFAFGGGRHRCLGSHLARLELRVAMEEFHRRIPEYRIKPGETPEYSLGIREVRYLPLVFGKGLAKAG